MNRKKWIRLAYCFLLSTITMLIVSSRTSPLYSLLLGNYGNNSAADAMLIGKYWLQGTIPYKDLFAVGGPFYFLIQAIGWLAGGRTGILILQIVGFAAALIYLQKAAELFVSERVSYAISTFSVLLYASLCCGGNSDAEFCLPFSTAAFYLVFKRLKEKSFSIKSLLCLGTLSGLVAIINFINGGLIYGLLIVTLAYNWKQRDTSHFFKGCMLLLAGILIPIVPMFLYFLIMGGFSSMLQATFVLPAKILMSNFDTAIVLAHKAVKCLLLLPFMISGILYAKKNDTWIGGCAAFTAFFSALFLIGGDNRWYYYLMALPCAAAATALFLSDFQKKRIAAACAGILLTLGICLIPFKNYITFLRGGTPEVVNEFVTDLQNYQVENENSRILAIDTDNSYFLTLDIKPICRYFTLQTTLSQYNTEIEMELQSYLDGAVNADILLTTEHGWVGQDFDRYTLIQVYCKKGGNICVYLSDNE